MLTLYINNKTVLETIYKGYLFDRIKRVDKLNQYNVYISGLNLFTKVNTKIIFDNYTSTNLKLYLIQDAETLIQKIRVEIIN
jgi:hypothetical protein